MDKEFIYNVVFLDRCTDTEYLAQVRFQSNCRKLPDFNLIIKRAKQKISISFDLSDCPLEFQSIEVA